MNRQDLRSELSFLLNFSETSADQDFSTTRLNKALQWVYEDEVRQAKLEGLSRRFRKTTTFVWPASQVRLELPQAVHQKNVQAFWDITNSDPGYRIIVRETNLDGGDAYWFDNKTLQWGSVGPASTLTIRAEFLASAEFLAGDQDEPQLIPPDYHKLIVWGAAVLLRSIADEQPPEFWAMKHKELQHDFWKFLSRGQPISDTPTVSNSLADVEDNAFMRGI